MAERRTKAIDDVQALIGSIDDLMAAMQTYRQICQNTEEVLLAGRPVVDALDHAERTSARSTASDALKQFEEHRHQARMSLVHLASDEGTTSAQFASLMGVSRQLVERWLKDARAREAAADGAGPGSRPATAAAD